MPDLGKQPTIATSPWNILVGSWLGSARRARSATTGEMAISFGEHLRGPYLRSIEAGANALPSSSAPALVVGYDLTFAAATQLVASVRMLDERLPQKVAADRPYNLARMAEQASTLRRLWPSAAAPIDWLLRQTDGLINDESRRQRIPEVRRSAREQVGILDAVLRDSVEQRSSLVSTSPLSPIVDDAVQEFLSKLSFWAPLLTRDAHLAWEEGNAERMTAVWGVVADSAGILRAAETNSWSFLVNAHRAPLRMAVPEPQARAQALENDFRKVMEDRLIRRGSRRSREIHVEIRSYQSVRAEVESLLWFDQSSRTIAGEPKNISQRDASRYVRMKNCWLYELRRSDRTQCWVGMIDNHSEHEPTFFSAALSAEDVERWRGLLERLHG